VSTDIGVDVEEDDKEDDDKEEEFDEPVNRETLPSILTENSFH
jgi:hypothetical protein